MYSSPLVMSGNNRLMTHELLPQIWLHQLLYIFMFFIDSVRGSLEEEKCNEVSGCVQ